MSYGSYQHIAATLEDQILTVTLNRPDNLNAFTLIMAEELIEVFTRVNDDDDVRAVVVTGAGRAFCAGADLSKGGDTFNAGDVEGVDFSDERVRDSGGRVTLAIYNRLKPVIAAVNGPAVGIGATMQLAMDMRIASEAARFGFVFARRGIVMEAGSAWFLPRIVGLPQALEWCYSGRVFPAAEALAGGLVKEVVPAEELLARAYAVAAEIRDNTAPVSIALMRQMLWRISAEDHPMAAHKIDSRGIYTRGASADVKEGVTSFLEKRAPNFPDKVSKDMPAYFPWWDEPDYS